MPARSSPSTPKLSPATSSVDPESARSHAALGALWADAVARHRSQTGSDVGSDDFARQIRECKTASEASDAIESQLQDFEMFRKYGKKIRGVLKPVVAALVQCGYASSDAAEATGKVSELYDTIEDVLNRIGGALSRFEIYLRPAAPISRELTDILISTLAVILDLLGLVTKYCKVAVKEHKGQSRIWKHILKRRAKDYLKVISGHTDLQDKVKELDRLTDAQSLHIAAETHVNVRKVHTDVIEIKKRWEVHENDEEYRRCEVWIEPADVDKSHVALLAKRQDSTCQWILEDADFKKWRSGANSVYSVLGHAGSGKSVMCALIIEQLRYELQENSSFTLAYFYFNSTSASDDLNNHRSLIGSLLFQIARSSPQCWTYLRQERATPRGLTHPTNEQLVEMLQHLLMISGPTFIVIDALDECHSRDPRSSGEQEAMLAFLGKIYALKLDNVHILVTSRPEKKILRRLEQFDASRSTLSLHDDTRHQEDLARFISERLSGLAFKDWGEKTLEKARKALTNMRMSQGMFLWVSLQLQHLEQCAPNQISDALDALPEGLDQTYCGILERFRCSRSSLARVRNILGLIAFAQRPLTPEEVAAAFAFNFEQLKVEPLDDEIKDVEGFVLQHLPSLISIVDTRRGFSLSDATKRTVQFIHFSVKEYLTDDLLRSDSEAASRYHIDRYFADIALVTLSLAALEDQPALKSWREYARDWYRHVSPASADGEPNIVSNVPDADARREAAGRLETALKAFLRPNCPAFIHWAGHDFTPLHCAARLALRKHVVRLLDDYPVDILDADKQTPLVHAILGTSSHSHLEVIDLLIAHGADIRLQPAPDQSSVLHWAIDAPKPVLVIDHLISKGAKVNATKVGGETALHKAIRRGHVSSVSALLGYGADINAFMGSRTALHCTLSEHNDWLWPVECLLQNGADPNLTLEDGCTPLHYAAVFGGRKCTHALLDGGADPSIRTTQRGSLRTIEGSVDIAIGATALHLTVDTVWPQQCEIFLKRCPELVDVPDWSGQTPVHYAARVGRPVILDLLLRHRSNAVAVDCFGRTPLDLARQQNRTQCVELLENHRQQNLPRLSELDPAHPAYSGRVNTVDRSPATTAATTIVTPSNLILYASLTPGPLYEAQFAPSAANDGHPLHFHAMSYVVHIGWSPRPSASPGGMTLLMIRKPSHANKEEEPIFVILGANDASGGFEKHLTFRLPLTTRSRSMKNGNEGKLGWASPAGRAGQVREVEEPGPRRGTAAQDGKVHSEVSNSPPETAAFDALSQTNEQSNIHTPEQSTNLTRDTLTGPQPFRQLSDADNANTNASTSGIPKIQRSAIRRGFVIQLIPAHGVPAQPDIVHPLPLRPGDDWNSFPYQLLFRAALQFRSFPS